MNIVSSLPSGSGASIVHSMLQQNISGYRVNYYSPKYEYFPVALTRFRDSSADLVHCLPDHAVFLAHRQQKLVVTFQNYVLDRFMWKYSTWPQRIHYHTDLLYFTKRALARSDVVTSVSTFTANLVKEELGYDQDIQVIYNGVDPDAFTPPSQTRKDNKIIVAFSGNPTVRKGAYLLPEICARLDKNIDIVCTMGLRNRGSLPSADNLKVVNRIPNDRMKEFYNAADILLMPTVREGLPLAVLEAMSCGLPIVASDSSSLPELVVDGLGGYLCSIDDAQEFSNKINRLARDFNERKLMGEYNRQRISEKFTVRRMVSAYVALFEKLLDGGGRI